METFSALLAICAGNSPDPGEFPAQRPVTRSFDVFFDLRPNKRLSKQWWGCWFETPSCPLWRHYNSLMPFLFDSVTHDEATITADLFYNLNCHRYPYLTNKRCKHTLLGKKMVVSPLILSFFCLNACCITVIVYCCQSFTECSVWW